MPVEFPIPPQKATDVLQAAIEDIARIDNETAVLFAQAPPTFLLAHQMYFVRLDDLADTGSIAGAVLTGWRYFVMPANSNAVLTGEVHRKDADLFVFGRLSRNSFNAIFDVFDHVNQQPESAAGSFEARLLYVPGLFLSALWLKEKSAEADPSRRGDIFRPLPNIPKPLEPEYYPEREFVEQLTEMAKTTRAKNTKTGT